MLAGVFDLGHMLCRQFTDVVMGALEPICFPHEILAQRV